MRRIKKLNPPEWFVEWIKEYYMYHQDTVSYSDLPEKERRRLRGSLIKEQGYICCYCMKRIYTDSSHIEHFMPREKYKEYIFDYNNLFASCQGEDSIYMSLWHCDQSKDNWVDENMPRLTDYDIEKTVHYKIDGSVEPYHKMNHQKYALEKLIIEKLGLNSPHLVRNRRNAIMQSEIYDDADYNESDWRSFIQYYDQMHNGMYEEYCGAFIDIIASVCL